MLVRMRSNRNFQSLLQLSSPEGPTWIFMGPYTPGNTRNVCQAEVPVFCFASRDGLQWRSGPGDTGRWWTDRDAPCPLLCCPRLLILSFWNCYINKHTVHNLGGLGFFFPLSIIFWTLSQVILMFFFHWWVVFFGGFPWWLSDQESACQCWGCGFNPWFGKIPWRREWQPTPVSCLENPRDGGAWQAAVDCLNQMHRIF